MPHTSSIRTKKVLVALLALILSPLATGNFYGSLRKDKLVPSIAVGGRGLQACQEAAETAFACAVANPNPEGGDKECGPCITEEYYEKVKDDDCANYELTLVVGFDQCPCSACEQKLKNFYECMRPECGTLDGDLKWEPPCFSAVNTAGDW